jgi:ribosomal protein S18 acetylase RimI-like enzyme
MEGQIKLTVRDYMPDDLPGCWACFEEGFFKAAATDLDRDFLRQWTQILIEKSNFTFVAECDSKVVGFLCGKYSRSFDKKLAKRYPQKWHLGFFAAFSLKFYLKLFKLSPGFQAEFDTFYAQVGERTKDGVGRCDCELAALSSRKDYRRGLGTALTDAMVSRCNADGAKNIRVFTNTAASYRFYEKYGFQLITKRPFDINGDIGASLSYEYAIAGSENSRGNNGKQHR